MEGTTWEIVERIVPTLENDTYVVLVHPNKYDFEAE